jgi:hypothetical protein
MEICDISIRCAGVGHVARKELEAWKLFRVTMSGGPGSYFSHIGNFRQLNFSANTYYLIFSGEALSCGYFPDRMSPVYEEYSTVLSLFSGLWRGSYLAVIADVVLHSTKVYFAG